jgi:hypothetical protein
LSEKKCVTCIQVFIPPETPDSIEKSRLARIIDYIEDKFHIDILLVGWGDNPSLYKECLRKARNCDTQVYYWYPVLSEITNYQSSFQVVGYNRKKITSEWPMDTGENFLFACPNSVGFERVLKKNFERLSSNLRNSAYDGVFLDRIRYYSPANGLLSTFCCFCQGCLRKADHMGIDLNKSRLELGRFIREIKRIKSLQVPEQSKILDAVFCSFKENPTISDYLHFKFNSIKEVIKLAREIFYENELKIGLDCFTPSLAPITGQSYSYLFEFADWIKPMTYTRSFAPAGIPCEIRGIAEGLVAINRGLKEESVFGFLQRYFHCDLPRSVNEIYQTGGVSEEILLKEIVLSKRQTGGSFPIYGGVVTSSVRGICKPDPSGLRQSIRYLQKHADGIVLSWDVFSTPKENIDAVAEALKS